MAVPARVLLATLPKGYQFPPTSLRLTVEDVSCYLDAVQDPNPLYLERRLAPPLAVAALALGSLLEVVELPAGTLHTGQEVEARAGLPIDAELTLAGRIGQRSERAGLIISVIEFELTAAGSDAAALTGRTTVLAPADVASEGGR
ncbi:MAG: hypothetical protein A2148_02155 [Chloroflexi bacterium RBG_16_68_14]|nr:MAG: hypothetical protein A2148_02155 [Chloroflexi bacterium RBG_16_68_14]